jgi:trans-2,3-dihydro-3-hydroxyanthranilate isomerase
MMECPFFILDVFTDRAFAGNQLAVVRDCDRLSSEFMQKIAREFNFPETIFVLAPRDSVNTARVRIFTPKVELPFAGHPTIGGAILIAQQDAAGMLGSQELIIAIEEKIGLIHCSVRKPKTGAARAIFETPQLPMRMDGAPDAPALARALGLDIADIGFDHHTPSHYSAGVGVIFVPVVSLDALGRAKPDLTLWDGLFSHPEGRACYVYARAPSSQSAHVRARMFAPSLGIMEDPATGAAAAAFAGVCLACEQPDDGEHQIIIEQGIEMGRPSEIALTMIVRGGELESVSIGGSAVVVASGVLSL